MADDALDKLRRRFAGVPHDGLRVHAHTIALLEQALQQLTRLQLPIATIAVGRVSEADVAATIASRRYEPQYTIICAVGVPVSDEAHASAQAAKIPVVHGMAVSDMSGAIRKEVNQIKKDTKQEWVRWVDVGGGRVTVWHRPRVADVRKLAGEGCTHVISLLSRKEDPRDVGNACKNNKVAWVWVPLDGANVALMRTVMPNVCKSLRKSLERLANGGSLLIHCAAGIHRTGTYTYSLLRLSGMSPEAARSMLWQIRPATGRGVGDQRIELAEELVAQCLAGVGLEAPTLPSAEGDGDAFLAEPAPPPRGRGKPRDGETPARGGDAPARDDAAPPRESEEVEAEDPE